MFASAAPDVEEALGEPACRTRCSGWRRRGRRRARRRPRGARPARPAHRRRPCGSATGSLSIMRRHRERSSAASCSASFCLELGQRLLGLLGRGRLAVEAELVLHQRDAAALPGLADDRGRALARAAPLERLDDRRHVVAVDLDRLPLEGLELLAHVPDVHDLLGRAVGLEVVVVDDRRQVRDVEVGGRHRGLPGLALLAVAVRHAARTRAPRRSCRAAGRARCRGYIDRPWPERAGRDLDPGRAGHVGWPWRCASSLRRPIRSSCGK